MRVGEHKEALVGRVRVLSGVVGVCLGVIAGAFWFVQVVRGSYYRDLAENNRLRKVAIKAPRGSIHDRNGRVMVENLPSYNLLLDRSRAARLHRQPRVRGADPRASAARAADSPRALPRLCRRSSRFYWARA